MTFGLRLFAYETNLSNQPLNSANDRPQIFLYDWVPICPQSKSACKTSCLHIIVSVSMKFTRARTGPFSGWGCLESNLLSGRNYSLLELRTLGASGRIPAIQDFLPMAQHVLDSCHIPGQCHQSDQLIADTWSTFPKRSCLKTTHCPFHMDLPHDQQLAHCICW